MKQGKFTFLGTGGSSGVPMIGCACDICRSTDPHNSRLRSSALIQADDTKILIDVGPDFRSQALKFKIERLSAVLLTHAHADHIAGMDDLRAYYFLTHEKLPCWLSQETFTEIKQRYHYMLHEVSLAHSVAAQLDFHIFPQDKGSFSIDQIPISYLSYYQNGMKVSGFRVGKLAYITDIRDYSEAVIEALKGVKILVLSALRHTPSRMHFSLEEAVDFARRVCAEQTYLTHIAHELDHRATNRFLPPDVQMSYDGQELLFEY